MRKKAFTLIEILIVVAVLGILAALVIPEIQDYSQEAKESNAKANLRILRNAIERYAVEHDGLPPGYPADNPALTPNAVAWAILFLNNKNPIIKLIITNKRFINCNLAKKKA